MPLGWTPDATYFAGGSYDSTGKAIWGGAYSILGDGVTATRGLVTQSAVADYNGAPRLASNTGYSARVRVRMTGALTQGTLHVHIFSASQGINTTGVSVPAAQVTASAWREFIAPITPGTGFTRRRAPPCSCANATPPSPRRTAARSPRASSDPQGGLSSALLPEPPQPLSPATKNGRRKNGHRKRRQEEHGVARPRPQDITELRETVLRETVLRETVLRETVRLTGEKELETARH